MAVESEEVDASPPLYVGPATASRQVLNSAVVAVGCGRDGAGAYADRVLESTSLSWQRVAFANARTIS